MKPEDSEKVIKNDEKRKHTYKDDLVRFKPLTKREQKDMLFILLDGMDLYEDGMEKAKTEEVEIVKAWLEESE